jgi:hypothetical protein
MHRRGYTDPRYGRRRGGPGRLVGGLTVALMLCLPAARAHALTNEALMDTLQVTAFRYFWEQANPNNGLIRDRSATGSPASIAAVGFGLSAICTGIDHGWVTRETGRARVRTTLNTFWTGPQGTGQTGYIGYKGLFYHFLDMATAKRTWSCEVSTIDTALLMAGILDCREYFSTADTADVAVRALADSIYYRADWDFFRNSNPGILMGWKPGTGFTGFGQWIGYNEAMILYILALGSPTHPVPVTAWNVWTSNYRWQTHYSYTYVNFPPLFGHQYSHCWIDFRSIQDSYMRSQGITYFENSRRATMAQRAYCTANPGGFVGYGPDLWGLTASDGPEGYNARGAPPAQNDNGTITPTAAGGSVAFAPEEALACLQTMWNNHRTQLWGSYGFKDAFNLTANWWGTDYIGIDEGPIILMIENHQTGALWNRFMQNVNVQLGLERAGFLVDSAGVDEPAANAPPALWTASPNPFRTSTVIRFRVPSPGPVRLLLHDVTGRQVAQLADGTKPAGEYSVTLEGADLASGVYYYTLILRDRSIRKQCVLIR